MSTEGTQTEKLRHEDVHYRTTTGFNKCWNCHHLRYSAPGGVPLVECEIVESPIQAEGTCDRWMEIQVKRGGWPQRERKPL